MSGREGNTRICNDWKFCVRSGFGAVPLLRDIREKIGGWNGTGGRQGAHVKIASSGHGMGRSINGEAAGSSRRTWTGMIPETP